ncbi:MAG: DUF5666 domain-containing protein [Patescibacteria group bacterium]|nr:DUF5666 domain-containing protein [Patescibacteria group bacterium]
MKNSTVIALAIVCLLLGGAAGYFVTTTFIKPNAKNFNGMAGQFVARGTNGGARNANSMGLVSGELIKMDNGSMSIKLRDGSSKLVLTTPSTEAVKMASTTLDTLKVGENVIVSGTANADGSLTAQTVQVRPPGSMMNFGVFSGQSGTQTGTQSTDGSTGGRGQGNQVYVGGPGMPPPQGF